jgi:penicillin-binding protein 1A
MDYDQRRGYRGPESFVKLVKNDVSQEEILENALQDRHDSGDLYAAVVLTANSKSVHAYRRGGDRIEITGEGLKFAQKFLSETAPAVQQRIHPGSIIRVQKNDKGLWQIVQIPQVEASLVSIDPQDGSIRSLVGGFDFNRNQFNHVTQAWRQPGSSLKPFIYSAALEKGFTPATVINDAPISFSAAETGSKPWEPRNFESKYDGPIRMREALAKSKNMVSVRILRAITVQYAQDYISRFGFDPSMHPPYMTMALGAGSVTPMQMAVGYTAFANGGFRVSPYFIQRIEDEKGNILEQAQPSQVAKNAVQIIDPRNAYLMTTMMQDVVERGTATRAKQLNRTDLAGKTGTTNDHVDAWFCGYQTGLVAVAWIGFDNPKSLGEHETGGRAALPIWVNYMGKVLQNVPMSPPISPQGVITARINPATGFRVSHGGIVEHFLQEQLPPEAGHEDEDGSRPPAGLPEGLM